MPEASPLLSLPGAVGGDAPDNFVAAHYGSIVGEQRRLVEGATFVDLSHRDVVTITGPGAIAIRTYERGVEGETLACGTGMVACALIAHELHQFAPPVAVRVKGGDTLQVGFQQTGIEYRNVTLHGPADFVFQGETQI